MATTQQVSTKTKVAPVPSPAMKVAVKTTTMARTAGRRDVPQVLPLVANTALEAIDMFVAADVTISALSANVWSAFARFCASDANPAASLAAAEQEYKMIHIGATLPAAYRSAKSVTLAALRFQIGLTTDDGDPRGKTAVQADLRKARAQAKQAEKLAADDEGEGEPVAAPSAYLDVFLRATSNLRKVWADLTEDEQRQAREAMATLLM